MKNKFLVLTLLLSNATLFGAQGGAPAAKRIKLSDNAAAAADQQEQVRSLQDITTLSALQMMKKNHPDIYRDPKLFIEAIKNNTKIPKPVKDKLIAKYTEATQEAARLWVDCHATNGSPLECLRRHKPELARLVDEGILPWSLSFKDIINADGADILASKMNSYSGRGLEVDFNNLSLTSLEGLQNIPSIDQIKWLSLNDNLLKTIDKHTFNGFSVLRSLRLDRNQLTTIHQDAFNGLTQFESLHLSGNQLTKIHPDIFNRPIQFDWLDLENNPLFQEQVAFIKSQVPESCQLLIK